MKKISVLILLFLIFNGCGAQKEPEITLDVIWENIDDKIDNKDSSKEDEKSQIYFKGEKCTYSILSDEEKKVSSFAIYLSEGVKEKNQVKETRKQCNKISSDLLSKLFPSEKDKINNLKEKDQFMMKYKDKDVMIYSNGTTKGFVFK